MRGPTKPAALAALLLLGSCTAPAPQTQTPPAPVAVKTPPTAEPDPGRLDGPAGGAPMPPAPSASYGAPPASPATGDQMAAEAAGGITLNFADTDIRAAVAQILGDILQVNYTIDPSVTGTVTLRTPTKLTRGQVLPVLQTLLAQNNATLVQSGGLYRVMAETQAAASPLLAGGAAFGGAQVVRLHYAAAAPLASVLQPYVAKGGTIAADPSGNALILQGDPATRAALAGLVQAFDVDELAGQSYALFPVTSGNTKDFADAFTAALTRSGDTTGPDAVTVTPLDRISAVLVTARARRALSNAARIYGVLNRVQFETVRSWHVYYLRNSRANDTASLLQQAFTPANVSAQSTPPATPRRSASQQGGAASSTGSAGIGTGASPPTVSAESEVNATGAVSTGGGGGQSAAPASATGTPSGGATARASASADTQTQTGIRVIPDIQNNSVLVYATARENGQIEAVLSKIDIAPLEVRIDATIAEVDLTGQLQYGTQFFFRSGGINAVLSNGGTSSLQTNFPGFVLSGHGGDAAPLAISALQSVTKVKVLSSPELMVLDGQAASLQVGDLVPYLAQTSQSTLATDSPVVNSIDYRETGVILKVTPHVGSDGLVTLDVSQEVSGVSPTITTTGLNSPTFTERAVVSRVAIQDGQTLGLAGLISDDESHGNSGVPWARNIPVLGALFSTQANSRTREEMLVLITPHVVRSQQQALDLAADMQQALPQAAAVPASLQAAALDGSADPDQSVRARIQ